MEVIKSRNGEVLITVPDHEAQKVSKLTSLEEDVLPESSSTNIGSKIAPPVNCNSPEVAKFSSSPNRPPRIPTNNHDGLTRRKSLATSLYSRSKSRFVEHYYPIDPPSIKEDNSLANGQQFHSDTYASYFNSASPNNVSARSVGTNAVAPTTSSPIQVVKDKIEDIHMRVKMNKEKKTRVKKMLLFELVTFLCMIVVLVASLTVHKLENQKLWGLEIWKWCVLVIVTSSGMLVTNWFMHFVVFLIEKNFLFKKRVLYFVHGLKKSVQVFIWLSLVIVAWVLLLKRGVHVSDTAMRILNYVTWSLVSLLIGAFLWLIKTMSLKILASNLDVNNFFDRIQESIFHQYVLQVLSGPALIEKAKKIGREPSTGKVSFRSTKKGSKKVIDMAKIHKMKQRKVSAWTMRVLVEAVRTSGLSTISSTLDHTANVEKAEQMDKEISSEMEAVAAAYDIFRNVALPGCDYIDEDDLPRFMIREEVDLVLPLFEGAETGRITQEALSDWVLKVYTSRKALAYSLNDSKTAVRQLNKLISGVLIAVTTISWLILIGIATTKVILFFSTQVVALAFMIGSTCKNLFESIVFVFVMHPFDVGDRCVIDGIPLMVEEMNLLTTIFLKMNNEKVFYPNSVLATKPISNYYRSPDMEDTVDFSIDFTTPAQKIALLKERIKEYLEENPHHWHPHHTVVVKEIENVNKLKMALYSKHTINFQEYRERNLRRTELVIAINKMFEELNIKYYLLPQQVHLSHLSSDSTAVSSN